MNEDRPEKIIIQFDGICILCSSVVRFILKADRKRKFLFQTIPQTIDKKAPESILVIDGDKIYKYSDAALKIFSELGGIYRFFLLFRIIPKKWRDNFYKWIARNRYRWFGKRQTCFVPNNNDQERFI